MKRWILVAFWLLTAAYAQGQTPAPSWQAPSIVTPAGASSRITDSAAGSGDQIYVVGFFSGSIAFGNTTLTSAGSWDGFVACYQTTSNTWQWAQRAGGTGDDRMQAIAVTANTLYVSGYYAGTATFGSSSVSTSATAAAFVAKLTATATVGTWAWAQTTTGTGVTQASGLAVNGTSLYVGGYFSKSAGFGPLTFTSASGQDAFIAKMSDSGAAGTWNWVQSIRGNNGSGTQLRQVVCNGSTVYMTGITFAPALTFGNLSAAVPGTGDLFVAKLVDDGPTSRFIWAQRDGTALGDNTRPEALAVSGNNVYVGGSSYATIIRFGSLSFPGAVAIRNESAFVVKLTDAGNTGAFEWVQGLTNGEFQRVNALAVDGTSVYVGGLYDAQPLTVGTTVLPPVGAFYDAFVAKLVDAGPSSTWVWAQPAWGAPMCSVESLTVSSTGVPYVSGFAGLPATFGAHTLTDPAATSITYLTALLPTTPLPVQLLRFEAKPQGSGATVSWATASETGSAYFALERSLDGQQFLEIGRVLAAGSSSQQHTYAWHDGQALTHRTYYRLRQVDLDHTARYSQVIALGPLSQPGPVVSVYPNPGVAGAAAKVSLRGLAGEPILIRVTDMLGRSVATQQVRPQMDAEEVALALPASLALGLYRVTLTTATQTWTMPWIVAASN